MDLLTYIISWLLQKLAVTFSIHIFQVFSLSGTLRGLLLFLSYQTDKGFL